MDEDATAEHDEGACNAREIERAEKNLGKEDEKLLRNMTRLPWARILSLRVRAVEDEYR